MRAEAEILNWKNKISSLECGLDDLAGELLTLTKKSMIKV